jgi:hypothetical protein
MHVEILIKHRDRVKDLENFFYHQFHDSQEISSYWRQAPETFNEAEKERFSMNRFGWLWIQMKEARIKLDGMIEEAMKNASKS